LRKWEYLSWTGYSSSLYHQECKNSVQKPDTGPCPHIKRSAMLHFVRRQFLSRGTVYSPPSLQDGRSPLAESPRLLIHICGTARYSWLSSPAVIYLGYFLVLRISAPHHLQSASVVLSIHANDLVASLKEIRSDYVKRGNMPTCYIT